MVHLPEFVPHRESTETFRLQRLALSLAFADASARTQKALYQLTFYFD